MSNLKFRVHKLNPEYNAHVRGVRKSYKDKYKKASSIASFPSTWFDSSTHDNFKAKVVLSICAKSLKLLELGKDAYYRGNNSGHYDQVQCWQGIIAYVNGSRNWDVCMGVNNPFLLRNSFIKN